MAKNKVNDKCYIGITTKTLNDRITSHINKANRKKSYFQTSLKKYGKASFEFSVIDTANTKEELYGKEVYWIGVYDSFNSGYNLTLGGDGITNMSQEIKDKISKSKTGVPNSKLKNRTYSDVYRVKVSRTLGGKPVTLTNVITGEHILLDTQRSCLKYRVNPKNLALVLRGKRKTVNGFYASYTSHANTEGDTKGIVHP